MAQVPIIGVGLLVGGILAVLAFAEWRRIVHRVERRNLASALTGEIVAVLRAVELENSDQATVLSGDATEARPPHLVLPRFTVYEANAGRLDHFAAPLPRKITYFFDRMSTLAQECGATPTTALPDGADRTRHFREIQDDLKANLDLADEILLDLRPLVSPHSQARHLV